MRDKTLDPPYYERRRSVWPIVCCVVALALGVVMFATLYAVFVVVFGRS